MAKNKRIQAVSKLLGGTKAPLPPAESFRENENEIRSQLQASGEAVFEMDPHKVRIPDIYNREEIAYTPSDPAFMELCDSIRKHGQDEPIHVRIEDGQYELISGRRRLEACKSLNRQVRCILSASIENRREAELEKWRENVERKNLSAYEQYRLWQSWIDNKVFGSQKEIAKVTNRTRARVSQIFSIGQLPDYIIDELDDRRIIQTRHADLYRKYKQQHPNCDDTLRKRIKASSESISDEKKLSLIFAPLTAPEKKEEEKVTAPGTKKVLCVIRRKKGIPTIHLKRELSEEALKKIKEIIVEDSV